MSTYEEERGEILLPSGSVVALRNALTTTVNTQRAKTFDLAEKIHAYLTSDKGVEERKALSSILRGKALNGMYQVQDVLGKVAQKLNPPRRDRWGYVEETSNDYHQMWDIERLLIKRDEKGKPVKLQAPKKKDIPLFPASKTWKWEDGEWGVSINPKTRMLTWYIPENNHAVDTARESELGKTLFSMLDKIEWTRGTGGVARYSNEYMRDADMEYGGGGSREVGYGPRGKAMTEIQFRIPRRRRTPKA